MMCSALNIRTATVKSHLLCFVHFFAVRSNGYFNDVILHIMCYIESDTCCIKTGICEKKCEKSELTSVRVENLAIKVEYV